MNEQYKNLIEKIKEKLDNTSFRWVDLEDGNGKYVYYEDVISSLPQVMEVIKGEMDKRMLSFFAKYSIDRPIPPSEIRKEWEDIINLLSEEDK